METQTPQLITVETIVNASLEKVWECWTKPEHIIRWNQASDDWHTTRAENDLRPGGQFSSRMEAKDGSFGFDFAGVYDAVSPNESIDYTLGDGRKVQIKFIPEGERVRVVESFEPETTNSIELQQGGWQAILDNFKKYTETQ